MMAGMTDYTGVAIGDIVEHLREWKAGTEQTIKKLHALRHAVEEASDRLHNPAGITSYIDYFVNLFSRFTTEFGRLITELPNGIRQSHADAVRALYDSARLEEALCAQFSRDHIQRYIEDDDLRHNVIDEIYGETRDCIVDYFDLSNLAPRLQALAGDSPDMRKPSTSRDHFKWAWFVFGCVFDFLHSLLYPHRSAQTGHPIGHLRFITPAGYQNSRHWSYQRTRHRPVQ